MATYDSSKSYFQAVYGYDKGSMALFAVSGFFSGLVASLVSAPIDLLKTRVMNDRLNSDMVMLGKDSSNPLYRN